MRFGRAAAALGALLAAVLICSIGTAGQAAALPAAEVAAVQAAKARTAVAGLHAGAPVVLRAELTMDCATLSAKAKRYAVAHGYCPATTGSGGVGTLNTVTGNCGSSFIYIYPWGYAGEADVYYGFVSSRGAVVYRYLNGYWDSSNGLDGSWTNSGYMASSSYSAWRNINAGRGTMYTALSGYVTLWWGATCYLLVPTDTAYVS